MKELWKSFKLLFFFLIFPITAHSFELSEYGLDLNNFSELKELRTIYLSDQNGELLYIDPENDNNNLYFYDKLEKSHLFLYNIYQTRNRPINDRTVTFLLNNKTAEGGTWNFLSNLINSIRRLKHQLFLCRNLYVLYSQILVLRKYLLLFFG